MKISAKAEYACVAVLDLAVRHRQSDRARLTDIAGPNDIPERFLVQILLQLKGAGIIESLRGASGGYRLAQEPSAISVWDVVHTIDGPLTSVATTEGSERNGVTWQVMEAVWREVNRTEENLLKKTDFAKLADRTRLQGDNMYYI